MLRPAPAALGPVRAGPLLVGLALVALAHGVAGAAEPAPAGGAPRARVPAALPGALPFPAALRARLAEELAARGAGYEPRTHQRHPDGSPRFTNRLLFETSPYLQQHAHNPVDWHPWGDEAFALAKRLGRPVLVSIGYSTCHWCHVMEEESFDDPATAEVLNAGFVAIKVDREVRPDVDAIYMAALQAMGQAGGWPLNVFLTPDRRPFYGGTYFPPGEAAVRGRPGFVGLLRTLAARYRKDPDGVAAAAGRIAEQVAESLEGEPARATRIPGPRALHRAKAAYAERFDPAWGGVGRRTKFPASLPVRLLLRYHRRTGDTDALDMATLTLEKIAAGGIHDRVGGGFHRYTVDREWRVPHFEKMLYDNALLALAYLEGWQATGRGEYVDVLRGIFDFLGRDLRAPEGGFYSATDADSLAPDGRREEGRFFTWTAEEIDAALPEETARTLRLRHGVEGAGPIEGRHALRVEHSLEAVASRLGLTRTRVHRGLEFGYARLRGIRSQRPPPLRDEKVLTAWNGLAIQAFARAGFALHEPAWVQVAERAAEFVLQELRREGRLLRVWKDGRASGPAFLEDHAFLIAALIDLYEVQGDPRWLREALALQAQLDRHYADEAGGAYYRTPASHETLLAREKPGRDGALPSGNSVAALNLLRLHHLTTEPAYLERAALLFSYFHDRLDAGDPGLSELLLALETHLDTVKEVVVVGAGPGPGLAILLGPLRHLYAPNRVLSVVHESARADHVALVPVAKGKRQRGGVATAYVCENRVCKRPTSDPDVLERQLSKIEPLPKPETEPRS